MSFEIGIDVYTLESIKQITSEDLRQSTGTLLCGGLKGKESEKEGICVYAQLIHFAVQQKLVQRCKATLLQWKLILKGKKKTGLFVPNYTQQATQHRGVLFCKLKKKKK